MVWVWLVSLPLTHLNSVNDSVRPNLNGADIAGTVLACIGFVVETWSDQSKLLSKYFESTQYIIVNILITRLNGRLDPAKKDLWCTDGLWKYSRHPNYFGRIH